MTFFTNYLMTLLWTKDGYYPKWMVKRLYNNILALLSEKDFEKLTKTMMKAVIANKNRVAISEMLVQEEDNGIEV